MKLLRLNFWLLCLMVILTACEQSFEAPVSPLEGTYTGYFIRSSPAAKYAPVKITLTFQNGSFSGSSELAKNPAICKGTYRISGKTIDFLNECFFTAEFDWSLILQGTYTIIETPEGISLVKDYGNGFMDTYHLIK